MTYPAIRVALTLSVGLAIAAPSAQAASPLVIGPGHQPSVAVDNAGTAHVVYNDNAAVDQVVHYCRLPRRASACGSAQSLVFPGTTTLRPHVFTDGQTVRILAWRYGISPGAFAQDFLLTSADGGTTFSAPVSVGTLEATDAVAGPGTGISIVSAAASTSPSYQLVPTDGSAPATTAARLSTSSPYGTTLGLLEGKTPVVAFDNGAATTEAGYSVYRGGDPNADGSWSAWPFGKGSAAQLAGGPAGVFVMLTVPDGSGEQRLRVSKLDEAGRFPQSGGFASNAQAGGIAVSALVQDDAGVLQALYPGGKAGDELLHNAAPGTVEFGTPVALVTDASFLGLQGAAGRDHAGVAVWDSGTGSTAAIHATRFATNVKGSTPSTYDLRAKGLEVTQAVQTQEPAFLGGELASLFATPREGELPTRGFGTVPYRGVQLAAYSKTVARFFADATEAGPDGAAKAEGVIGLLRGFRNGKELPGSPLLAENGTRTLTNGGCVCVTAAERLNAAASYDFTLPLSWTVSGNSRLTLRGEVRQQAGILTSFANARLGRTSATRPRECSGCAANNAFTLVEIPFIPTPTVVIAPVRMLINGQADLPDPAKVFEAALNLHPGGERFLLQPYQGNLDVSKEAGWTPASPECKAYVDKGEFGNCKNSAYFSRVRAWDHAQGGLSDMAIGINTQERGAADRSLFNLPFGKPDLTATAAEVSARPIGLVDVAKPFSSVGHELGHLLGRVHASKACGGNGEDWAPDQVGYVDGIGLDRSRRTADPGSPYRVVGGKPPTLGGCSDAKPPDCGGADPKRYFDLMSYCAGESSGWISVRNWQAEIGTLNRFGQRVGFDTRSYPSVAVPYGAPATTRQAGATAGPGRGRLHVEAMVNAAGAFITDVRPALRAAPPPTHSDYVLVVSGRDGAPLSSTPMAASAANTHGGAPLVALTADVPGAAAMGSVAVVSGGATIAARARSAHPPTVRVTSPRSGASVAGRGLVRWTATDSDKDPLSATVAYSLDDGRTWRTIYSGPSSGSATLPGAYFSASRRSRVLVRVNDGFDETGARSARFGARGVPPVVRILSPKAGERVLNSSMLVLSGQAIDDASQPITRRTRLAWFAGRRLLGHGASLSTADLVPGRQRIRLVATDRTGRRGTASTSVRVIATKPQLLELNGPKRVGVKARTVALRIAVSVRSKLTVNGRSFTVGRKARGVRVAIRPGRRTLRLHLVLRAGGKRTALPISLPRG